MPAQAQQPAPEMQITEFKSIKWVAWKLFYIYKLLAVCTIPLITILYVYSTMNIMGGGLITDKNVEITFAAIYAICFEMNGLRLVIDGRIEQMSEQNKAAWVDYLIGGALVTMGTISVYIDGLVNAKSITWEQVGAWNWIILGIRSAAVICMIFRECIHYAPLVIEQAMQEAVKKGQKPSQTPVQKTVQKSAKEKKPWFSWFNKKQNFASSSVAVPAPIASNVQPATPAAQPKTTIQETTSEQPAIETTEVKALPAPESDAQEEDHEEDGDQGEDTGEHNVMPDFTGKKHGSNLSIVRVVDAGQVSPTAQKIYDVLAKYDQAGKPRPSHAQIAAEAQCTRVTVSRILSPNRKKKKA